MSQYIRYKKTNFRKKSQALITTMDETMADYQKQGFTLTLRQLYYQLVARDVIANDEKSYNKIGNLCNDARLAGMLPWDIEDRTRQFIDRNHWNDAGEILRQCAYRFHMDLWATQPARVFVVIEKDALRGVIEKTCRDYDVPLLSARGYPSASVLQAFATGTYAQAKAAGQEVVILHLGDHDPSGIDMTDDLQRRLSLFTGEDVPITRIGLTLEQVREINPPPNGAKEKDRRYPAYVERFGITDCWELDALSPQYLVALLDKHINKYIEPLALNEMINKIKAVKGNLLEIANMY